MKNLSPLVWLLAFLSASCSSAPPLSPWEAPHPDDQVQEQEIQAMGATFKVRIWRQDGAKPVPAQAFKQAIAQIRRVAQLTDGSLPKSEISRINGQAARGPVKASKELFDLLMLGQEMSARSNGIFDITFVRIQEANEKEDPDAGLDAGVQESANAVAHELKNRVGSKNLALNPATQQVTFAKPGIKLGVLGMARGYAVQKAAESLLGSKVAGFTILGGGVMAVSGKALEDPQVMCVEHPNQLGTCAYRILPLNKPQVLFLAQSAVAERPGHIYNAKNGLRKARAGGVTIMGTDGAAVQAAAVAAGAMDNKKTSEFLARAGGPRLAGVYFENDFSITLNGTLAPFAKTKQF